MSIVQAKAAPERAVAIAARRILSLGLVAGYIDALGFVDLHGIYTAAMTGNTVQLGLDLVRGEWAHFAVVGATLGAFFCGGLLSSFIRRRLTHPAFELLIMAALVSVAQAVRAFAPDRSAMELPLLAVALAMQGETISRFAGVPIQTIVVTNNLLKFADAIVGRYLSSEKGVAGPRAALPRSALPRAGEPRPTRADVVLPGCAWLAYAVGAASGVWASGHLVLPLLVPVVLLAVATLDLGVTGAADNAR
jgi:uncharacterized membrane protein YoaK (UPF0700 family)